MKFSTTIITCSLFLLSCGNSKKNDSNSTSTAENVETNSCFVKYLDQMDKMLTKEDILKYHQADFAKAELDYDTTSSPEYSNVTYYWKGNEDRTERRTVNGKDYGPKSYKIGIGYLHFYDADHKYVVETFTSTYKTMTAEEKEKARKAIQKELDKAGVDKQKKKTSGKITGSILPNLKFDPVDGVGDAAVWDYLESSLKVLKGRAIFDVIVDVSDNHEENVKLAKALAKEILNKCE